MVRIIFVFVEIKHLYNLNNFLRCDSLLRDNNCVCLISYVRKLGTCDALYEFSLEMENYSPSSWLWLKSASRHGHMKLYH
jgi:hypothetical protein